MKRWQGVLVLAAASCVACGGGSSGSSESSSEASASSGGESVDLSPEALLANYERNARSLQREWSPGSPVSVYASQAMEALRAYGSSRGYVETFRTLEVVSADWGLARHRASGIVTSRVITAIVIAQFPDGRCMQYAGNFAQEAIGSDFVDQITSQGLGGGVRVPCEMADAVAQRPGVAQ